MSDGFFDTPQSLLSNPSALNRFSRKLARQIKTLPQGCTHDDVAQDAAVIVLGRCRDWIAGDVRAAVPFQHWIWPRCLGDLRDKYKTQKRRFVRHAVVVLYESDLGQPPHDPHDQPDTYDERYCVVREEEKTTDPIDLMMVRTALDLLTDAQRAAIEAVYFEGLTQAQYAARTGVTQPAVASLLKRALQKMRTEIE